ncbi:hypothetical protein COLO4_15788 [Corchorus olitorius]|uniref:Uncharacterized protein n=1 Tax=Corchorus olitorius TaxID=93759 RepID=A0A1R3JL12_9ROSI|nr:hypothetical protein COLO4_15788 [Corchorus olitorius]
MFLQIRILLHPKAILMEHFVGFGVPYIPGSITPFTPSSKRCFDGLNPGFGNVPGSITPFEKQEGFGDSDPWRSRSHPVPKTSFYRLNPYCFTAIGSYNEKTNSKYVFFKVVEASVLGSGFNFYFYITFLARENATIRTFQTKAYRDCRNKSVIGIDFCNPLPMKFDPWRSDCPGTVTPLSKTCFDIFAPFSFEKPGFGGPYLPPLPSAFGRGSPAPLANFGCGSPNPLPETSFDELNPMCLMAICSYNEKNNSKYEFLKIKEASTNSVTFTWYFYITFLAQENTTTRTFKTR